MSIFFRVFLSFNSIFLFVAVYLIKEEITMNKLYCGIREFHPLVSYLLYLLVPIILTGTSLWLSRFLSDDEIDSNSINALETANNQFLPTYLGYFFVALSIPNQTTFYIIFTLIFVFTLFSQASYFNPLFLLFKYNFFFVTDNENMKLFVITRQKLKGTKNINLSKLKRINDYTFLDKTGG